MNLDRFPRHPLTFGPTPLERLERLSAHLGGKVEIWAKREDCNSGLAFGGNKIRKMEYLVPDILAKKCDTLVSIGGVQSNHTRQVAAVAAKLGLKCHLVQGSWVNWPDGLYDRVGNIQLSRVLGAEIMFSREDFSIAIKDSWQRAIEAVERAGGRPYAIRPVHRITHSAASATHALPTSLGRRSAISVPGSITLSSRQLRLALRRAWWSGSGRRVDRPR